MKKSVYLILLLLCIILTACAESTSIGIIGGSDGPTAVFTAEAGGNEK